MTFKKKMFGYNTAEVDRYIRICEENFNKITSELKERIDQLSEENSQLAEQVERYRNDELAISKSLIESQRLASELKGDAEKFADITLSRAKIFYATWQAFAKTLVATLSDEEVARFNEIYTRMENVINAFEGNGKVTHYDKFTDDETVVDDESTKPSDKTMGVYANPITKVEEASGHIIELNELLSTDETLEELCKSLGIKDEDDKE